MTPRQHEALSFIKAFWAQHNYGPSYQEICSALNLKSKHSAHRLVRGLAEQGEVNHSFALRRSVRPVVHECPKCGAEL